MSNEAYTTYSLAPYYRIRHYTDKPGTVYKTILFHTIGATLYSSIHFLSTLLIYGSTQNFLYASTIGLLYFVFCDILYRTQYSRIYVVDLETGAGQTDDYPKPKSTTETTSKETETSCETESGLTHSHID